VISTRTVNMKQRTDLKASLFVLMALFGTLNGRAFIIDDGYYPSDSRVDDVRVRRESVAFPAPVPVQPIIYSGVPAGVPQARSDEYHHDHHKHYGSVGPVYTFVKTDPHANFKWGVRHRVGQEYH